MKEASHHSEPAASDLPATARVHMEQSGAVLRIALHGNAGSLAAGPTGVIVDLQVSRAEAASLRDALVRLLALDTIEEEAPGPVAGPSFGDLPGRAPAPRPVYPAWARAAEVLVALCLSAGLVLSLLYDASGVDTLVPVGFTAWAALAVGLNRWERRQTVLG